MTASRQISGSSAVLLVVLFSASVAHGQEPKPLELRPAAFADGEVVDLEFAWRFHPGDDPRWSDPAVDDSGWEVVEPLLAPGKLPAGGWPGVGWFRRHLRCEPSLAAETLAIRVEAPGAARVFLDNEAVLSSDPAPPGAMAGGGGRGAFGTARFSARADHLLAVRYELRSGRPVAGAATDRGFRLSLATTDAAAQGLAAVRRRASAEAAFVALPSFLALLHLALFWSYPKARENLFYSISMAAFAGIVICDLDMSHAASAAWRALALRATTPFVLAAIFFVLLTFFAVRTTRLPRTWIGFAVAGLGLAAWSWFDPSPLIRSWAWYLYFGAMIVETVRVGRSADTAPREGISILRVGLAVNGAVIVLQILINLGVLPPIAGTSGVYVFGMLALAVAMSLFLARSFARTSVHLEQRLAEVHDLSEQVLMQQQAAHQQELHRLLLSAEHERKSSEIAAARELQLSMRPASLPQVAGLEIAAVMTTATEVGGDYYDFKIDQAGRLIVALGDATGHGVAAGTMVTAIKAIFSVLGVGESLPKALAECSRVLRGMNTRQLHMCLMLGRINPRGVTVCSAAMPPALLYRAGTAEVEELRASGLPLGTRLDAAWEEHHADLAPGDTLLFATDGFAELLDPQGTALGYDGAASAFRAAAGGAGAAEVLRRLMEHATAWRADREPTDDLTLVAVRVNS